MFSKEVLIIFKQLKTQEYTGSITFNLSQGNPSVKIAKGNRVMFFKELVTGSSNVLVTI